jgi:hypothetical protein
MTAGRTDTRLCLTARAAPHSFIHSNKGERKTMALAAAALRRCPSAPPQAPSPPGASHLKPRLHRGPFLRRPLVASTAATAPLTVSSPVRTLSTPRPYEIATRPTYPTRSNSFLVSQEDAERRKHELLRAVQETQRGFAAGPEQRAAIEEAIVRARDPPALECRPPDLRLRLRRARRDWIDLLCHVVCTVQVSVEELSAGEGAPLDLAALDGTWRLCYTSASDVLVLFEAAERLPLLQVFLSFHRFCWFLVAIAICKPTEKPSPSNQQ